VRAVLDPNVLISSIISAAGAPAQILARWRSGEFELVVSELLLEELERALRYPKIRKRLQPQDASALVVLLREHAQVAPDPRATSRAPDPGDDYLVALAATERAVLVSGDQDLLGLADAFPILSPRLFLETLEGER
jgi:putative PIN family toxin of toxin-antitoxin system